MRFAGLVLRPGADGAMLVPDVAYPRAFTLRIGRTDQSYVDLDDPLRLEFDYVQRLADVLDSVAEPGERLRVVHVGGASRISPQRQRSSASEGSIHSASVISRASCTSD